MRHSSAAARLSYGEYLARERTAAIKSEFLDGAVFAMASGTVEHGLLATNMARLLGNLLLDRACVVLNSDVRVRGAATGLTTYPDLSVVCGPIERADDDPDAVTNPVVLVEVLSDSTEAYDRGEKFAHYRRIASLRAYVLVAQRERRVEVFQRTDGRRWAIEDGTAGEHVALPALDATLAVDEVYRNVAVA